MHIQVVSKIRMLSCLFLASWAAGCVTTAAKDDAANSTEAADPELGGEDNVPAPKITKLGPGLIEDIDLKELVYQGVEKQLVATENEETSVEIGDFESFKFSVTKMTKGGEDVTSVPTEQPDRLFVELTGWYKRTAKTGDEPVENCFSFESIVALTGDSDSWVYDDKEVLKFNRESSEDCY